MAGDEDDAQATKLPAETPNAAETVEDATNVDDLKIEPDVSSHSLTPSPVDEAQASGEFGDGKTKDVKETSGEHAKMTSSPAPDAYPTEMPEIAKDQAVNWSKTLQSPTLPAFSPSIDVNKSEPGFHGTGLQLSIHRGRQLNKTTSRCLSVLQELASLYMNYAISISKAGKDLPAPTTSMMTAAQAAGLSEPLPLLPLQESITQWAQDKSEVAKQMRAAVAPLLQNYLSTHTETINGIQQRYTQSRHTCAYARRRALSSYSKYTKAFREAEHLIAELKSKESHMQGDGSTPVAEEGNGKGETDPASETLTPEMTKSQTPSKAPKRLEARAKDTAKEAKLFEHKYKLRVGWENDCVSQCQRLESMSLETMQKMEEDRLSIFISTMLKVMAAQKEALDTGVISLTREVAQGGDGADPNSSEKKKPHKFVQLLSGNSFLQDEDSSGVMDAETLGLPDEIGKLRDKVRARLNARRERIQLAKALSLFFESVVKAAAKLGQSLSSLMKKEATNFSETLPVAMGACEGAHVLRLWDLTMTSFLEAEAQGSFAFADSLRNVRAAKLDSFIMYGEKSMKATTESDDAAWKHLCEAARAQAKAENKYRQSSMESAKARERVLSLDSKSQQVAEGEGGKDDKKEKRVVGKRMQKGLANLASLLPDGGDKAMKMLGKEAQASHAQRTFKETEEKEAKEKQVLVAAVEASSAALTVYKNDAEHIVARYDEEEKAGWQDIQSSIESFAELAQKLLGTLQLESINDVQPLAAQSQVGMCTDMNDWRMRAQQELVAICVDCTVAEELAESGFKLEVHVQQSSAVEEYLAVNNMAETKEVDDDVSVEDDMEDEEAEDAISKIEEGTQTSNPEANKQQDEVNVKNLFRRSVLSSQLAIGNRKNAKKLHNRERTGSDHEDPETDLFLTYFWPDPVEARGVPMVVDSFPCSFRDGAQQLPFQYGRVYLSSSRIIFVSWTKKKLNLRWEEVRNIKSSRSFDSRSDCALQIVCKRADAAEESCMVLDGFYEREAAVEVMGQLMSEAKAAAEALAVPESSPVEPGGIVPPDKIIQQMEIVVSKYLRNISIERFYEIVWSEKEKPLFRSWLEKEAFDIEMGDWKPTQSTGPWCKEKYNEDRLIKFRVKRKTHLYIGPPIANVVQVHRCRREGNNKCVVAMTVEFEGIPFSDTFAVEVRWVALRDGQNDIKIECGLVVDFKKKTYLKSKIQSGTIEESTPVHRNFFNTMRAACAAATGVEAIEEQEEPEVEEVKVSRGFSFAWILKIFQDNPQFIHITSISVPLLMFFVYRFFLMPQPDSTSVEQVLERVDALEAKIDALQNSIDELLQALQASKS